MIHEHEDMLLASAAIDFPLTDEEAERLRGAVADCPVCADRAAAYRRNHQLLAELPVLDPSAAVRRRVAIAAMTGRTPTTGRGMLLLAAALAIGAILALLALAGGGSQKPKIIAEFPPVDGSTSPAASFVAVARDSPVPRTTPRTTGGESGIAVDSIASVVSNNLRVRSAPRIANDSLKFEPLLLLGDRLFVLAGPVTATNHDWYQVAAWRPSDPSRTWPIGWVADADISGERWIAPATVACSDPPTVDVLAAMNRLEALSCYGSSPLAFRALVTGAEPHDPCPAGGTGICLGGPTWLAGLDGWTAALDARGLDGVTTVATLAIAREPAGPDASSGLISGRMATLSGSFDHPASRSCAVTGEPTSGSTVTATDAVLRCRTMFVVDRSDPAVAYLTRGVAAVTVTPNLRVRSQPVVSDASVRYDPLLAQGTRLFVIGGPVTGSGYDWFRVIAPTVSRSGGGTMIGWVAVAGKDGETWAKDLELGCPGTEASISLAVLSGLASAAPGDGGVSCFGESELSVSATVTITCSAGSTNAGAWLAGPPTILVHLSDGTASLDARGHPDLAARSVCEFGTGAAVVRGHFGDPDAEACASGEPTPDDRDVARYRCRSIFVVSDIAGT